MRSISLTSDAQRRLCPVYRRMRAMLGAPSHPASGDDHYMSLPSIAQRFPVVSIASDVAFRGFTGQKSSSKNAVPNRTPPSSGGAVTSECSRHQERVEAGGE